jgi:hypothetical protein
VIPVTLAGVSGLFEPEVAKRFFITEGFP